MQNHKQFFVQTTTLVILDRKNRLFKNFLKRTSLLFTGQNICGFYRCNIV